MENSNNNNNNGVKVVGFWVSLFTQRVRWALKIKGIEYEYIEEDINNKTPLISELNPVYAKVPILVHGEISLPESTIILEYIDQVWAHDPLLPPDPYERADARFWARFADQKVIEPAWLALNLEKVEDQERAAKLTIKNLEKIEEKLNGKTFFGGETIGYLDLVMGFIAYILPVWEEVASFKALDPVKFPAITAWTNKFLTHPVVQREYLPPKAEVFTYYRWRRSELLPVYAAYGERIWSYVTE